MSHHQAGVTLFNRDVNGNKARCCVYSRRVVQSRAQLLWNDRGIHTQRILQRAVHF